MQETTEERRHPCITTKSRQIHVRGQMQDVVEGVKIWTSRWFKQYDVIRLVHSNHSIDSIAQVASIHDGLDHNYTSHLPNVLALTRQACQQTTHFCNELGQIQNWSKFTQKLKNHQTSDSSSMRWPKRKRPKQNIIFTWKPLWYIHDETYTLDQMLLNSKKINFWTQKFDAKTGPQGMRQNSLSKKICWSHLFG